MVRTVCQVVGWERAEGRLTKQCFCYFTSTAPQRELLFFFLMRFASVKPLFLPFFVVFFVVVLAGNLIFCLFLFFFLSWCWLEGLGVVGGWWGVGGGGGGLITFFRLEHIWDNTSWDLLLHFNTSGMVRHEIFSYNSTHLGLGWYVMRSFLTIQHIWDGTSWDLFLQFNTSGMVRHEIFSYTSTHLGWYVMRSFLTLQHIWDGTSWDLLLQFNTSGMVRHEIFSYTSTHLLLQFNTSVSMGMEKPCRFGKESKRGSRSTVSTFCTVRTTCQTCGGWK